MTDNEKRQAWLAFASAAIAGAGADPKMDEDDVMEFATEVADGMLEVYEELKFEKARGGRRARGGGDD
jgi:hypothetical protein